MNKPKYTKRIFRYVILAIGVCCVGAQSAPGITLETGRDNPFAKLAKKNTTPQNVRNTSGLDDGTPELFLQTVTLKFLNAQSLEGVIGGLCSGYGSIATDAKTNSLIICDTKERLEKILAQIRRAEETMTPLSFAIEDQNGPNLFVETVTLKFLDATNLGIAVKKMSSEYGSISVDKNSNSLIVCDTKRNLEMILVQIRKADKTPEQIRVEVVIADVVLDDDTEIGIDWNRIFESKRDLQGVQTLVPEALSGAGELGAHLTYTKLDSISGALHALQQVRNVEILANPSLFVISGGEGFIKTIEEIPYEEVSDTATGGEAALTSTQFKEVGVTLTVKAIVTDDGKILMTIQPEQSVTTGDTVSGSVPNVDKRSARTTLLMDDGEVVIMGGLKRKETTITKKQVPLLGDLPLVGFIFTNSRTKIKNTELLVFISPHIHKGEPVPVEAMAKFKEIKDRPMLSLPNKRDAAKKKLLKKIKMLQSKPNEDVSKELLSTLHSLDKILSEEIKEALSASEKDSAGRKM
jgi:type II secretory pathway component GspD/PulD (secretin)